ncbi:SMI1/KNR4 family protein [Metabacillus litoralis]|uniref:SMI1/KNR4 family protein n=1 Tax=Metabacillus litoralis TaxID=152268 RepID=UPI001CFD6215|nr:SMI1/KNR4 family protein [Metabacillus litoralis]
MYTEYEKDIISILSKFKLEISDNDTFKEKLNLIQGIEEKYNLFLPESYKCFLLLCNNGFFSDTVSFNIEDSEFLLNELYCLTGNDNLTAQIETFLFRMPQNLIPIGERPNGDQVCIGVKEETNESVFLWYHENELEARKMIGEINSDTDTNSYYENIEIISNSFLNFLNSLKLNDKIAEEVDLDDVEIWLDDDLLND